MKYHGKAEKNTIDAFTGKTEQRGGRRQASGRKSKWYGDTIAMRVPESWADAIKNCMICQITPNFLGDNDSYQVQELQQRIKELENVQKQKQEEEQETKSQYALDFTLFLIKQMAVCKWQNGESAASAIRWAAEQGLDLPPNAAKSAKRILIKWSNEK